MDGMLERIALGAAGFYTWVHGIDWMMVGAGVLLTLSIGHKSIQIWKDIRNGGDE